MSNEGSPTAFSLAFLHRMMHDLKAPVRHVRGFGALAAGLADEIRESTRPDDGEERWSERADQLTSFLDVILRSGDTLGVLLDSVSAMLKVEESIEDPVRREFGQVVQDAWTRVLRDQQDDGKSKYAVRPETLSIEGDLELQVQESVWRQILHQILDNSVRYRDPDRELQIHLVADSGGADLGGGDSGGGDSGGGDSGGGDSGGGDAAGKHRRVIVRDNACGFDEQLVKKAVQPFERLVCVSDGRPGLGLALVSEFVSRLQGELRIQPTPSVGTSVEIQVRDID